MIRNSARIHTVVAVVVIGMLVGSAMAAPKDAIAPVVESNTAFALDLYKTLADSTGDNVFFSPYSISSALVTVFIGAANETKAELRRVLHFPKHDGKVHAGFSRLMTDLNSRTTGDTAALHTANGAWIEGTLSVEDKFLNYNERFYKSALNPVDFINAFEPARLDINKWVEERTRHKIVDLLPAGSLNSETRLVLANAIYFRAGWTHPFAKERTAEDSFHTNDGDTAVPFMMQAGDFSYYEDDTLQVVRLPYDGNQISMLALLPRDHNGLNTMTSSLDSERLTTLIDGLDAEAYRVDLRLPRFKITHQVNLNDALSTLGMASAFADSADFSGITTEANLFISNVFHKAYVAVDEEGTEAAAATAISIGTTSVKPPRRDVTFRADHPFIFMIVDDPTRTILFMGRVSNPATSI